MKNIFLNEKKYTEKDYLEAIKFVLNYPTEVELIKYNSSKDIYKVRVQDGGWYEIRLQGDLIRKALKWKGKRKWMSDIQLTGDDYAELFKGRNK